MYVRLQIIGLTLFIVLPILLKSAMVNILSKTSYISPSIFLFFLFLPCSCLINNKKAYFFLIISNFLISPAHPPSPPPPPPVWGARQPDGEGNCFRRSPFHSGHDPHSAVSIDRNVFRIGIQCFPRHFTPTQPIQWIFGFKLLHFDEEFASTSYCSF